MKQMSSFTSSSISERLFYPLCLILLLSNIVGCQPKLTGYGTVSPLVLEIQTDRDRAIIGEPVHITLTLTNTANSGSSIILNSPDQPLMDIVILGADLVTPRWSKEQTPENLLHHLKLSPGASHRIEWIWIPSEQNKVVHAVTIQGNFVWSKDGRTQFATVLIPVVASK